MAFARWQMFIADDTGAIVPNVTIQVRREVDGLPLEPLYADADGLVPLSNPFQTASDGLAYFHARGGYFRIRAYANGFERVLRLVPLGTSQSFDAVDLGIGATTDKKIETPAGLAAYDAELEGFSVFVADIGDGRAGITFKLSNTSGDWSAYGIVTGPEGTGVGLSFDVVVENLTERALYDAEDEGFRALVTDSGDGRAAIYVKLSGTSGDWSDPSYLVGDKFDLSIYVADNPYSAEDLCGHVFTGTVNFPAGLTGSRGFATDAPSADAEFTIKKNGTAIGSITFAAGSHTASFSLTGGTVCEAGDVLSVTAPEPQDATLWQVSITLAGTRAPATS